MVMISRVGEDVAAAAVPADGDIMFSLLPILLFLSLALLRL